MKLNAIKMQTTHQQDPCQYASRAASSEISRNCAEERWKLHILNERATGWKSGGADGRK